MRMTASWSGRYGPTEYKVVARYFAPDGKLPLGLLCCPTKKITGARSKSALTENAPYKACSAFTRVAACTLALSPMRDTLIEGFSHFVFSMTAPIASGWSGCRVGLAPTGKRRLVTAHTLYLLFERLEAGELHVDDLLGSPSTLPNRRQANST